MGDRYIITVECPNCKKETEEVWYAPACGVTKFPCDCGHIIDLVEYTGISHEDASNKELIGMIAEGFEEE